MQWYSNILEPLCVYNWETQFGQPLMESSISHTRLSRTNARYLNLFNIVQKWNTSMVWGGSGMSENVCGTEGRRRVFATVAQSQRPTAVSDIRLSSRSPRLVECVCVLLHHMPWIAEVCVWSPVCGRSKIHSCQRAEEITLIHTHTWHFLKRSRRSHPAGQKWGDWTDGCVWMRGR